MTTFRRLFLWFALALTFGWVASCRATTLTGTVNFQGQPLNGYVDITLSYPGTNGSALYLPGSPRQSHLPIYNGQFPSMTVPGNDTLLPRRTFYQVTYYDAYASPLASLPYFITGSTFDMGAAVPTPVTTNNLSFLDLIGLRTVSTQNLIVNGSFTIGTNGATFGPTGVTNAKQFDDLRFTTAYLTGSTTCGLTGAIADLPATGGTVILQAGTCPLTQPVTISKSVHLIGLGPSTTTLVLSGSGSLTISGPRSTLEQFTITGSATDSLILSAVAHVTLSDLILSGAVANGVHISGASSDIQMQRVTSTAHGGQGVLIDGAASGITISQSALTNNTGDGLKLAAASLADVSVTASTLTGNITNGVEVTSLSTSSTLHLSQSTITDNHNAGVLIAAGVGHTIDGNIIQPGSHQLYGIYSNYAGATATTQLELRDNRLNNNLTNDIFLGGSTTSVLIYPQVVALSDTTVHNSIAGGVSYIQPGLTVFASGTLSLGATAFGAGNTDATFTATLGSAPPSGAKVIWSNTPSAGSNFLITQDSLTGTSLIFRLYNGRGGGGGGAATSSATTVYYSVVY